MICVTGDMHADRERLKKLTENLGEDDYLIICGDFGFIFSDNKSESDFLDEIEKTNKHILWIDGNHCNFDALNSFPVESWKGGRIHKIRRNIFHLMRGQIFTIEKKTFFTMGGAYSIDKSNRTEGKSWWPQELPCSEEYHEASENLKKYNYKVDYILTHQMPQSMIIRNGNNPDYHDSELTGYLEYLLRTVSFKHWYCGHWHQDKDITDNFTVLFYDVIKI